MVRIRHHHPPSVIGPVADAEAVVESLPAQNRRVLAIVFVVSQIFQAVQAHLCGRGGCRCGSRVRRAPALSHLRWLAHL